MEVVGCKAEADSCTLRPGPEAMLFHGISGDHIQGIMEEMERRSKTESRLAKGMQLNGRESVRVKIVAVERVFAGMSGRREVGGFVFWCYGKTRESPRQVLVFRRVVGFPTRSCLHFKHCQTEQCVSAGRLNFLNYCQKFNYYCH